jgi:hypothetical protein
VTYLRQLFHGSSNINLLCRSSLVRWDYIVPVVTAFQSTSDTTNQIYNDTRHTHDDRDLGK